MTFSNCDTKITLKEFTNHAILQWASSVNEHRLYKYLLSLNPKKFETPFNILVDLEIVRATRANHIHTKLNEWGLLIDQDYTIHDDELLEPMLTRAAVIQVINYYKYGFEQKYVRMLERIAYEYAEYEEDWEQMNESKSDDDSSKSECDSDESECDSNSTTDTELLLGQINYHTETAHNFIATMHEYARDVKSLATNAIYVIGFAVGMRIMGVRAEDIVGAMRNMFA